MISFVGAGPGAPDLLTLRGASRLSEAEIVIWASSLVPQAVLSHTSATAKIHDSAIMTLEDVLQVYQDHPRARIVRLHSGDPSIYGALQEQLRWCQENEREFEIVPGVSSVSAAAALLQRELTVPGVSQSVILTRLASRTSASVPEGEVLSEMASHGVTMAVFLSAARPKALQQQLLSEGSAYNPQTPAAIVVRASWPDEKVIRTSLGRLSKDIVATGATTTVLVLVGDALADPGSVQRSHLYSPGFAHSFRRRSTRGTTTGRPASKRPAE